MTREDKLRNEQVRTDSVDVHKIKTNKVKRFRGDNERRIKRGPEKKG